MPNRAIISLAILKVNWDQQKRSYLDNFVPIIAECLRLSVDDVVSLPLLRDRLRDLFGLTIPQNVIKMILRRAKKQGYVRQEWGVLCRSTERLAELGFADLQRQVVVWHEALIRDLRSFCSDRFSVTLSAEEAEEALLSFLEEHQLVLVGAAVSGTVIPEVEAPVRSARYLMASFIQHLQSTHAAAFAYLEAIVKGNMLASAVYLPDPNRADKNFRNTGIYFDTSFLIYALGYAGESLEAPCRELLELLYAKGAQLRCFRHTLDEVRGALDACADRMASGQLRDAYGPSIEYFLAKRYTASDVQLLCLRLEQDLQSLRVRVVDRPRHEPRYVIDEGGLESALEGKVGYRNPQARIRDVDSIAAIVGLRTGQEFFFVEECRALFVTTNTSLSRAVRGFFYRDATPGAITPCITDDALTTLLWLKSPQQAPELPRKRIIADCYAAMQPEDHLWQRYLDEIDRLERTMRLSADDYYLMRYSIEAKAALMELTLGDEQAFTAGTIADVLDLVRTRVRADLESRMSAAVQAQQQAEQEARTAEAREAAVRACLRRRAQRLGSTTIKVAEVAIWLLLLVGTLNTFPWRLPPFRGSSVRYLLGLVQLVLLVLSVAGHMYGTTIRQYLRSGEIALSRWIYRVSIHFVYGELNARPGTAGDSQE